MRGLILSLLLVLGLPVQGWATVTFYWGMENNTPTLDGTTDYTAGADTTATVGSSAAIGTTPALIGTYGLDLPSASDNMQFTAEAAVHNIDTGSMAFYLRVQTWVNTATLLKVRDNLSDNDKIEIKLSGASGSGTLTMRTRDSVTGLSDLTTTGDNLALNTTCFVTMSWDYNNNDRRIVVYDASGTVIETREDLTTAFNNPTDLTGVPCHVSEEPLLCVVRGTGIAIENLDLYKKSVTKR